MHVPLFDPRTEEQLGYSLRNVEEAKKLMNFFDRYNVTMVFASHIHGFFQGVWGNASFIITGGAGVELVGIDPRHYFYHYVRVAVNPRRVIPYDVVKLDRLDFNVVDRIFWAMWIHLYAFLRNIFLRHRDNHSRRLFDNRLLVREQSEAAQVDHRFLFPPQVFAAPV
ncbi:MAG: hypothetical protein J7J80_08695 [Thermotogae bacterium]|nr:hypothetical protein [Thermotogota bacterium]